MSTTYTNSTYLAEIVGQGFEASAVKNTPCFALRIKILHRLDGKGSPQPCPQFERMINKYLGDEKGAGMLKGMLRTIGVEISRLSDLAPPPSSGKDAPPPRAKVDLTHRQIQVICTIETYQGRLQEKWDIPRAQKKLDQDQVRGLDDQFGHLFNGGGQPPPDAPPITPNDSDVPF